MRLPMNSSTLNCLLSAVLVIQLVVLATRYAAWQRYRKWQDTGEVPGGDPRNLPQTSLQAWGPVASSGYGVLVMAGGLLAEQFAPTAAGTILAVVVVAYLPALLADPILFLMERLRKQ